MSPPAVTIELEPNSESATIVFCLGKLAAIEDIVGRSVNDLVFTEFADISAKADPKDPNALLGTLKRLRVVFVRQFIAACLGITTESVPVRISLGRTMEVFSELAVAFVRAVVAMNGGGEDDSSHPQKPAPESAS